MITGPIGYLETSVRNYRYTLSNVPKGHDSHLLRGGSLKSRQVLESLEGQVTATDLWVRNTGKLGNYFDVTTKG